MASKGKKTSSKTKKTGSKTKKTRSSAKKKGSGKRSSRKVEQPSPVESTVVVEVAPGVEHDEAIEILDLDVESDREEIANLDVEPGGEAPGIVDLDADLDMGEAVPRLAGGTDGADLRDKLLAETMALVEGKEAAALPAAVDGEVEEADDSKTRDGRDTSLIEEEEETDQETGFDLGPSSTPEERALLLAAALAHAEMQEARYRVPLEERKGAQWKGTLALAFFGLGTFFALVPPDLVVPAAPAQLGTADMLYGIRVTLLLQAEQIEAFRAREQRLPDSLDDLAVRLPGVRYVRSSNRLYQLIAYTARGQAVVFDSAAPNPDFEAIVPNWAADRGS